MTKQEAISYLEKQGRSTNGQSLERTRTLLEFLGNPQKRLKFVHVAGSNGKGSTCAMLDAVLRAAGYRTGLYTSPHIQEFCERIQVNGRNIPDGALAEITAQVRIVADTMDDHPSQFELVTAIAMVWFLREQCDIVVLEAGLGGARDSTNVIDPPEVAVITNIGLEHTEYLGNTVQEIALSKAGIIKMGCHCICYDGPAEVTEVIQAVCTQREVPVTCVDFCEIHPLFHNLSGQRFMWRGEMLVLPLLGAHQLHNAAVVLLTVDALRRRGWHIDADAVREGLRTVKWPARFEVLNRDPLFVLDGGHNPQCAQALAELLRDYLPGKRFTFLMGILADKNCNAILDAVEPVAARFLCVAPDNPRAVPAQELAEAIRARGGAAMPYDSVETSLRAALEDGGPVVAFGSLYMAGTVRTALPGLLR